MNFLVKLWLHLDVDKTLANDIGRSYNTDVVFDASKKERNSSKYRKFKISWTVNIKSSRLSLKPKRKF